MGAEPAPSLLNQVNTTGGKPEVQPGVGFPPQFSKLPHRFSVLPPPINGSAEPSPVGQQVLWLVGRATPQIPSKSFQSDLRSQHETICWGFRPQTCAP